MARKKKAEPESVLSVEVNGHQLTCEKRGGFWTFACASWPALAEKYTGNVEFNSVMTEFLKRCLEDATTYSPNEE